MNTAFVPFLNPQIVGATERALSALMRGVLLRVGGSFPQWGALSLVAMAGSAPRSLFVAHLVAVLKVERAAAEETLDELVTAGLVEVRAVEEPCVVLTDAGHARYQRLRSEIDAVSERVFGTLTDEELTVAGRVLAEVTARANAELVAA
jgi:DNA-binding MarR family transcriptional regulator